MAWICTRCSNDASTVRLYTLKDGRKRPYCLKHMPHRKEIAAVEVHFRHEKEIAFGWKADALAIDDPEYGNATKSAEPVVDNPPPKVDKPSPFKVGMWVRVTKSLRDLPSGSLVRITENMPAPGCFICDAAHGQSAVCDCAIEPALPRAGEWWSWHHARNDKTWCEKHGGYCANRISRDVTAEEFKAAGMDCCFAPINFGRGEGKA